MAKADAVSLKKEEKRRLNALSNIISKVVAGFAPPENQTVSQWAEKYRRLSPESSAESGPWRNSRTPYLVEPMDAFTDPKVHHIVMVAASQVGKSELINNIIGYIIDQMLGSILLIEPQMIDAREYSKLRISPMIRDCITLRRKVSPSKTRDSANTILQKSYVNGILTMCGSTEAHALASKPLPYVLGDERDRWAQSAGKEGDPWGLAMARQATFYDAKSVEVSTPTIKGHSAIEDAFYTGTQERWCVQCPHCDEYSNIVFADIRYEHETVEVNNKKTFIVKRVYYVCPKCGAISEEYTMKQQPAKWVASNPSAYENGTRSFWLNAFVSPWKSWKSLILAYLQAIGSRSKMQVVFNTGFGELWEDRGELEDEDSYLARREDYEAELPDGVLVLTCGVDTQDDRLEYEVAGYGLHKERWGIRKGIIMGKPDDDLTWSALDDVLTHVYQYKNGKGLRISTTFVDEGGHYTQDVRLQCRKRIGMNVFAIKGRGGNDVPYTAPPRKQQIVIRGKYLGECWVYLIGVNSGKQAIMANLGVQTEGPKYYHFPRNEECGYDHTYFMGLLSEHYVYNEKVKKNPWQWVKIPGHERNEPLDCCNYANAAVKALAPDMDAIFRRRNRTTSQGHGNAPDPVATAKKQRRPPSLESRLEKYFDC